LAVRDPPRLERQQAIVAEVHLGAALGASAPASAVHLAVLDLLRQQHLGTTSPRAVLAGTATAGAAGTPLPGTLRLLRGARSGRHGGTALQLARVGDHRAGRGASASPRADASERPRAGPLDLLLLRPQLVAVVHPHLHADGAHRRLRDRG